MNLSNGAVAYFRGSVFALRRETDAALAALLRPSLLVYVPADREALGDALVELEKTGTTIFPGAHPWQRNTRLSAIARRALRDILGDEHAATVEKDVEQ